MADTTNPVNPATSTTSANATTNNDLPVINLDALQAEETQSTESKVEWAENSSANINSVTSENIQTENAQSEATATAEDPFEGLNIVLGDTTPKDPVASTTKSSESFVDPFLNPKKAEASEVIPSAGSNTIWETTANDSDTPIESTNTSGEAINLDAMLASVDTSTTTINNSTNTLWDKKRKMIMIGSGVIGMVVLLLASYFVFTTMFPSGTELSADINWPQWTILTGSTGADNSQDPITWENVYKPDTTTTPDTDPNTIENTTTKEDELTTTPAETFGQEDELPAGDSVAKPEEKIADTNITSTGSNEEELPSDVKPEVSKAIEDLNRKIEWAKQLLTLLRTKPNPEQTKELAWIIKEIKSILTKLNSNEFTSFTEEIEKPMTDLGFRYDKLTSAIVGN